MGTFKNCDFCKYCGGHYICNSCNGLTQYEERENAYSELYKKYADKWHFNDGLHGVTGSYLFCRINGRYCLSLCVSDRRYFDKRKTKEIFTTYSANEMRNYLEAHKPENNK